jgi:hypothetical protein
MSVNQYRRNVERLNKDIDNLDKQIAKLGNEITNLEKAINQIRNSITKNTSTSALRQKEQQIQTKRKSIDDKRSKVATLQSRRTSKLTELNRNLQSLVRVEENERNKKGQLDKKRRDEELRHAKSVTNELQQQARIHAQLRQSPIVIDLTSLPTKIKVLFFASNPADQESLRLDEEVRAIQEKIRMSEYRDSVELVSRWAVRPDDLLQSLNEHKPHIIHFSGHGDEDHIAFVGNSEGETKLVTKDAIVQMIKVMLDNLQVVIFNTCLSSEQAQAVSEYVNVAIGMTEEIDDDAARVFAAQFYSAIGFGRSVQQAFDQGIAALIVNGISEDHIPMIYHRDGVNPSEIILVRP